MKNSPLTISLLIIVVLIWAWIMYSVFDYMDSPEVYTAQKKPFITMITNDSIVKDYVLVLNYKDPFLKKGYNTMNQLRGNGVNNTQVVEKLRGNHIPKNKIDIVPESILIPIVKYAGRIQNAKLNKPIAILFIDNREYMMQEGEVNDGVLLKEIMNDSVKIAFSQKIFYVKK